MKSAPTEAEKRSQSFYTGFPLAERRKSLRRVRPLKQGYACPGARGGTAAAALRREELDAPEDADRAGREDAPAPGDVACTVSMRDFEYVKYDMNKIRKKKLRGYV